MATLYQKTNRLKEALDFMNESLRLRKQKNEEKTIVYSDALYNKGYLLMKLSNYE